MHLGSANSRILFRLYMIFFVCSKDKDGDDMSIMSGSE